MSSFNLHDITFLKLEITTGIDDDVGQAVPLLADVHVVDARQVQRLHARSHKVGNLGPLDHLRVVVPRLVHQVDGVLRHQQGDILLVSGGANEEMDGWLDEGAAAERTPCARVKDTSRQRWKELRVDRQKDMIRNTVSKQELWKILRKMHTLHKSHLTIMVNTRLRQKATIKSVTKCCWIVLGTLAEILIHSKIMMKIIVNDEF